MRVKWWVFNADFVSSVIIKQNSTGISTIKWSTVVENMYT